MVRTDAQAPSCTLVVPTHGRPGLVVEAVDSALGQRAPFAEVIVVCDGPDAEVERALADRPVRVLTIDKAGVAAARKAGVEAARTPWVAFLDDDDLLHPDYLAEAGAHLAAHADAVALSTYFWVFADRPGPGVDLVAHDLPGALAAARTAVPVTDLSYLHVTGDSYRLLLERLRGSMSTTLVSRDVLEAAGGFPVGRSCAEDWTMYVHVARSHEWHVVPRRLAFFRDHPGANTRTGRSANGLQTVRAIHGFWTEPGGALARGLDPTAYRRVYRASVRDALDAARADREWGRYRELLGLLPVVLPDRRDRLTALVPGPVWRGLRAARDRWGP